MIKSIKIHDFKSIREIELELDPVTVLVGRSGTGKSNLVQAIRFLRNFLLNPNEAIQYKFGWDRIVQVRETRPKTSIEVCFSVPGEESKYTYYIGFGTLGRSQFPGGGMGLKEERFTLKNNPIFSRIKNDDSRWEWKIVPQCRLYRPPMNIRC